RDGDLAAGIVHQGIESSERLGRLLDERFAEAAVRQVAGEEERAASRVLHEGADLLGVGLLIGQVGQGDVGALPGEGDRDRRADPGVRTGDEGSSSLQPSRAAIRELPAVRLRDQGLVEARLRWSCWGGAMSGNRVTGFWKVSWSVDDEGVCDAVLGGVVR